MCSSITEYPNGFPIQIEWEYTKKPNPNQTFYYSPFTIININLNLIILIYTFRYLEIRYILMEFLIQLNRLLSIP